MKDTKKLWVVVVTFNSEKFIRQCLDSVFKSRIGCQVIVIDNNSTDSTNKIIEQEFPNAISIKNRNNIGFGSANNTGIRIALEHNAEYIFLLNQDAWVDADCFDKLISVSEKNPDAGIVSPLHFKQNWEELESLFKRYVSGESESLLTTNNKNIKVEFVNAAGWLIPRRTFEIVGGFDPIFFMYGEDVDFINRMFYHNMDLIVTSSARMVHARINSDAAKTKQFGEVNSKRQIKQYSVQVICHLKNLEKDFRSEMMFFVFDYMKKIIRTFLTFRWRAFGRYFVSYFTYLYKINRIRKHRNLSKHSGRTFL